MTRAPRNPPAKRAKASKRARSPTRPRDIAPTDAPKPRMLMDRTTFVPLLLNYVATKASRGASKVYLELFGIGINEWRIISILAHDEISSANEIIELIDLDGAAASRNIASLEKAGYLRRLVDSNDGRRLILQLTPKGVALHGQVQAVALKLQERLIRGLSAEEVASLRRLLTLLRGNAATISEFDYAALVPSEERKAPKGAVKRTSEE